MLTSPQHPSRCGTGRVFISYRRETGADLARLVRDSLQRRGYEVFLDVEDLRSGPFNEALLREIETSTDVVVILTPGALDRCRDAGDWVRREIAHALACHKSVVPVWARGFALPAEALPDDISELQNQQALTPSTDYFEASMDRLASWLVGRPRRGLLGGRWPAAVVIALVLLVALAFLGKVMTGPWGRDDGEFSSALQIAPSPGAAVRAPAPQVSRPPLAANELRDDDGKSWPVTLVLVDGTKIENCRIKDHNPGPIGDGWDMTEVGVCSSLRQAVDHKSNRSRNISYSDISRIDVVPFAAGDQKELQAMDTYDRDKVLKCNIRFWDGTTRRGVFLLPHYLGYVSAHEKGDIQQTAIRSIIFTEPSGA